ncbi:MAG: alpha-L-fucosidase, partial [Pyrinomonadaceae bacterium]
SKEFLEEWLARNQELIDNYQPDILWFDNGINDRGLDPVKLRLAAYYYNRAAAWKKQVSLSTKHDAYLAGTIKDYERQSRAPKETTDYYWQVDDPVLYRFGYTEGSPIVDARTVITRLIENVSRNGALLLNISPKADGTIPDDQQKLLLEIGRWMDENGEGIYGTRPWIKFGEGERDTAQFRFTAKKNVIFAYALGGVANNSASIVSLSDKGPRTKVTSVELLGREGKLKFTQRSDAFVIELPQEIDRSLPFGFRIKVKQ